MNFTKPSDFKNVSGDIGEIEIDNNIMPSRATDDKNKLRGMDVAFLQEAIEERRKAVYLGFGGQSFSKSFSASQMSQIANRHNEIASTGTGVFVDGEIHEVDYKKDDDSYPKGLMPYLTDVPNCCSKVDIETITFGENLLKSDVESAYSSVRRMNRSCRYIFDNVFNFSYTSEVPFDYKSDGNPTGFVDSAKEYTDQWMGGNAGAGLYGCYGGAPAMNAKYLYKTQATGGTVSAPIPDGFDGTVELWGQMFFYSQRDPNWTIVYSGQRYCKISDTENFYASQINSLINRMNDVHTFIAPPESWFNWSSGMRKVIGILKLTGVYPVLKISNRTKWY